MLIDSPFEFMKISMDAIITGTVLTALFFIFIVALGLKAQKRKKTLGNDALLGMKGIALADISSSSRGNVRVLGEIWKAASDDTIRQGDEIIIVAVDALLLKVKKI
ncbi:MAG: NfeD family protein [Ignavibacteriae bacterium]|nr:NfeD family protein [Ignavibacteriota bacterium]